MAAMEGCEQANYDRVRNDFALEQSADNLKWSVPVIQAAGDNVIILPPF